jgi:hypothetical protein
MPDGKLWGCSDRNAEVAPERNQRVDRLEIERLGGLAGFGGPGSRIKSKGEVALADLSAADRQAVADLFDKKTSIPPPKPDAFRYRITRQTAEGTQTIEAPEDIVPPALRDSVRDTLE